MTFEDRYGVLDRLLHRVAFASGSAQRAMADLEKVLYRDALRDVEVEDPVFVTALPRAGTTVLLQLLAGSGDFASHTYRDMPFVLAPMLWGRFRARHATDHPPMERAHGDGIELSSDSPEAFEEMVWKVFWPGHYRDDRIVPWTAADRDPEFDAFLLDHMRKVIVLRRDGPDDRRRYVSKNNANIARLEAPPGPLRRGTFVVPFREPVQHAASMLVQHRRFTELQSENAFLRRYMEAVGHHEFGLGLKPIDFGGWLADAPDPGGPAFWIAYWIAAYRHVLEHAGDAVCLLSYRHLTESPDEALQRLAGAIGVDSASLTAGAASLRSPRRHEVDEAAVPSALLREAAALHEALEARADREPGAGR